MLRISCISIGHQNALDWFLWESCCTTHYRQVAVCCCSTHNPRRWSWTWSWDKKFVHCQFEEGSRARRALEPTAVPLVQRWVRLCSWQHDGTSYIPSHTSMHVHVSNQQIIFTHRCGRNNMELNRFQMISNGSGRILLKLRRVTVKKGYLVSNGIKSWWNVTIFHLKSFCRMFCVELCVYVLVCNAPEGSEVALWLAQLPGFLSPFHSSLWYSFVLTNSFTVIHHHIGTPENHQGINSHRAEQSTG